MMNNQILACLKTRRSVRSYRSDPVPQALLDQIVEAGLYAPTGMGRQSTIIIEADGALRDRLMKMNAAVMGREGSDPFYGAPVALVVLADRSCPTYLYDGSLAMGNMMNAAHALGLGSCWIHRAKEDFDSEAGKEILRSQGIEGDYEGIGHCIVGYAEGEEPAAAPRKENRFFKA